MNRIALVFLMCLMCSAGAASAKSSGTLLDTYFGMMSDDGVNYEDSHIDNIPGLMHREYAGTWYKPADSWKFPMSAGVYLDETFPTDAVKTAILEKVNEQIGITFEIGDTDERDNSRELAADVNVQPVEFLNQWDRIFKEELARDCQSGDTTNCEPIVGARGCTVCHKIYEDGDVATYIVSFSYDAHGGSGCTYYSDYYTIDKTTGNILGLNDIMAKNTNKNFSKTLYKDYAKAAKKAGFQPKEEYKSDEFLKLASGAAIVDEGILIYFKPYTIGCGAEGQYNLIIRQ